MEAETTVGVGASSDTELPAPPPAPALIDVAPPADATADTEPPSAAEPAEVVHVAHVVPSQPFEVLRVGGRAGVRVTETSLNVETRMKRVSGGNDEGELGVMVNVPARVLADAKRMLMSTDVGPSDLLALLGPWFPQ